MFTTTIRLGGSEAISGRELHLIGISSRDNYVYIYQLQDGVHPKSLFVLYKVNPIIPKSWQKATEFESYNEILCSQAAFNRDWTQIALRFVQHKYVGKKYNGFVLFDLLSKSRNWWPLPRYFHPLAYDLMLDLELEQLVSDLMTGRQKIVETSIGWLAIFRKQNLERAVSAIYKIFSETVNDPVLYDIPAELSFIAVSFDHLFYIEHIMNEPKLVIRRLLDFEIDARLTIPYSYSHLSDSRAPSVLYPEFTGDSPLPICLIYPFESVLGLRDFYSVSINDGTWQLNSVGQCANSHFTFHTIESLIIGAYGPYPFVLFCLYPKLATDAPSLAMVNLNVPTLKHFSMLAVQKMFGMKADKNGDLHDGIAENGLKEILGCSEKIVLF